MSEQCKSRLHIECTHEAGHDSYHSFLGISQKKFRELEAKLASAETRLAQVEGAIRKALRANDASYTPEDSKALILVDARCRAENIGVILRSALFNLSEDATPAAAPSGETRE